MCNGKGKEWKENKARVDNNRKESGRTLGFIQASSALPVLEQEDGTAEPPGTAGGVLELPLFPKITAQTFHGRTRTGIKLAGSDPAPGSASFHVYPFFLGYERLFHGFFSSGSHPPSAAASCQRVPGVLQ